jgi:hypothetical protein
MCERQKAGHHFDDLYQLEKLHEVKLAAYLQALH